LLSRRALSAWWLPRKEWRELATSRPFLIFAVLMAPLVGQSFVFAVATYAEVSGAGGGASALSQGVSPLDGIVVPTFGAYAMAISLLFPFAAIRLVSAEKESGGLDLMLQSRHSLTKQIVVKFVVLLGAWVVAWLPGLAALALWRGYGGHLYAPETLSVLLGHLLRAALVVSVAILAAAVSDGAAAAAVLTLAFTLTSWALDFVAQVQGGLVQQIADLAPEGMLRAFERGEVRLDVIAVMLVTVASNLAVAIVWLHPGRERATRWAATVVLLIATTALTPLAGAMRASWDVSEDRRSSFPRPDERALGQIREPVRVEVNLAPEDPRLADLDREVLRKLRRTLPNVAVVNTSRSNAGLFEPRVESRDPRASGYGEVWYQVGSRRAMSRSTTEPIVLELIYGLAGVVAPARDTSRAYPGYPRVVQPTLAPLLFYLVFPGLIAGLWWWYRKPGRRTSHVGRRTNSQPST
jgi:ABC-2 type transport system permease protein